MHNRIIVFFAVVFLLLSGCVSSDLGFKTTSDCDQLTRVSQQMECYHTAAITTASIEGIPDHAVPICNSIWNKFSAPSGTDDSTPEKAELIANTCLFDVARMTRSVVPCSSIQPRRIVQGIWFSGVQNMQDMCNEQISRIVSPQDYFNDPTHSNLCTVIAIIPMAVFGALFYNRQRSR